MGGRINTIMQTCFFAISRRPAARRGDRGIKHAIEKTYGKRGEAVVQQNFAAVDAALAHLHEVAVPAAVDGRARAARRRCPPTRPTFVRTRDRDDDRRRRRRAAGQRAAVDGTFPTGTAQWEKRNIADSRSRSGTRTLCIQCGKCVLVCPHA